MTRTAGTDSMLGLFTAKLYVGAGVGPYITRRTHIGGKLFAGFEVEQSVGAEMSVHLQGNGDVLFTLEMRKAL